jgi:hypothetical protein
MELLAAAAACTIRDILYKAQHGQPIHIFSDSRSTVLRLQDCGRSALRRLANKRNGALLYSLFRKRRGNIGTTHHVYSHPERRKPREQFTPIEYGNMLAHEAASPLALTRVFPGFARFSISAEALLRDLLCPGQWYIGNSAGTPLLTPAADLMTSELTADYLRQRDDLRQSATPPRPPFWATASLRYAAKQFDCSTRRTFAQQTRVTKLIYDKYFHGENSIWFQVASYFHQHLRLGLLLHEVRNKIGKPMRVTVGEPIAPEEWQSKDSIRELLPFLREKTLSLSNS